MNKNHTYTTEVATEISLYLPLDSRLVLPKRSSSFHIKSFHLQSVVMQLSTPWLFSISLIAFIELCSAKIQLFGDPSLFSIDVNDVGIIRNV